MPGNKNRGRGSKSQRGKRDKESGATNRSASNEKTDVVSLPKREHQSLKLNVVTDVADKLEFMSLEEEDLEVPSQIPPRQASAESPKTIQRPQVEEAALPSDVIPICRERFTPPKRPGYGREGRKIKLRANFFPIKLPDGDLYHYDVTIAPTCARQVCREIVEALVQQYSDVFKTERPVFDGRKNMYSRHPILGIGKDKTDFTVKYTFSDAKEKDFKVSIKNVARVSIMALEEALNGRDSMPYDTIQALDVVMRHLHSSRYVPVGRSFFSPPEMGRSEIDLGSGREIWFGFHQSLRPSQKKMLLNVDVSATAFYKSQKVLDFFKDVIGDSALRERQPLRDADRGKFRREIKGLKVEVNHLGKQKRKYRVTDVSIHPANKQTFPYREEGKEPIDMTVANYFQRQYQIALRFPYLPCLQVGDKAKHIYLPLEVCDIVAGQRCAKKLTDQQTAQMIRGTARDASARFAEISKLVYKANYKNDPYIRGFGMTVDPNMVELDGRVIDAPTIQYASKGEGRLDGSSVRPKDGKWDMRNSKFVNPVDIHNWSIILCCPPQRFGDEALRRFKDELCKAGRGLGTKINPELNTCQYCGPNNIEKISKQIVEEFTKTQLLVYITMKGPKDPYEKIKTLGDLVLGVPTQVILLQNALKAHPQTLSNLCFKINAKVGGVNNNITQECKPSLFLKPVIFLGADVTHPAPGDDRKPSIAAVVGSLNASASRYSAVVRVQKHRQEIIADLKEMTKQLLMNFYKSTKGKKPEKIIMYRDGVSEGQFQQVLMYELVAIRQACKELDESYEPGITFVVVQKRHHARFSPQDKADAHGKGKNIPPGTVVDRGICHPSEFDFYLCSHAGIQGTSRPSHYHVLWDDNNIGPDEFEKLTYLLCHVYVRCTRAVSIPAPAYYAHLVAFRARHYLSDSDKDSTDSDDSHSSGKDGKKGSAEAVVQALASKVKLHEKMALGMYFV